MNVGAFVVLTKECFILGILTQKARVQTVFPSSKEDKRRTRLWVVLSYHFIPTSIYFLKSKPQKLRTDKSRLFQLTIRFLCCFRLKKPTNQPTNQTSHFFCSAKKKLRCFGRRTRRALLLILLHRRWRLKPFSEQGMGWD